MTGKQIRLFGFCLVFGLITALVLFTVACSSKSASTSTTNTTTRTLSSVAVTPSSPPDLKTGFTQQFKAIATYSDGSRGEVTDQVTWTSSESSAADFINSGGLLTGLKAGTTNITASLSGKTSPPVSIKVYAANPFQ